MWTLMSSLPVTLEPEIGSANRPSKGFFPVKKNHQQPRQVNALTVAHHKPSVPDHTLHEFVHTLSVTDHALTLADQYQFCLYNLCRGQVGQLHLSQGQDHGGGEGQYPQGTGTLLPIPSDINHLIGQNQASWGFSEIKTCINFHRLWPRVHHDQTQKGLLWAGHVEVRVPEHPTGIASPSRYHSCVNANYHVMASLTPNTPMYTSKFMVTRCDCSNCNVTASNTTLTLMWYSSFTFMVYVCNPYYMMAPLMIITLMLNITFTFTVSGLHPHNVQASSLSFYLGKYLAFILLDQTTNKMWSTYTLFTATANMIVFLPSTGMDRDRLGNKRSEEKEIVLVKLSITFPNGVHTLVAKHNGNNNNKLFQLMSDCRVQFLDTLWIVFVQTL